MKKCILLLLLTIALSFSGRAQFVTIPDSVFVQWLDSNGFAICINGNQLDTTCVNVLQAGQLTISAVPIRDLTGIQYFKSLWQLDCSNDSISIMPPMSSSLRELYCQYNLLTTLPALPDSLTELNCGNNLITSFPAPLPAYLNTFSCDYNAVTTLPALPVYLGTLTCANTQISALPALPATLRYLDAANNGLTAIPALPPRLTQLYLAGNLLTSLPTLPDSLGWLDCQSSRLVSLPALPSTLGYLFMQNNLLTSVPALPPVMYQLLLDGNQLTTLPALPNTLISFSCENNHITVMSTLPDSLEELICGYGNKFTSLPALPLKLKNLYCQYLPDLTSLPVLPDSLTILQCNNDSMLTCLPELKKIGTLNFSATPVTCLPDYGSVTSSTPALNTLPLCGIFNNNGCQTFWDISGQCFYDQNNNCVFDGQDSGTNYVKTKLYNGGTLIQQTFSGGAGFYSFDSLNYGNYIIRVDTTDLPFVVSCSATGADSLTLSAINPVSVSNNFAFKCRTGIDLGVTSIVNTGGFPRPAAFVTMQVTAGDISALYGAHCAAGTSGQVQITYSGDITYVSPAAGALTPTVSGNTLTYTIVDFGTVNDYTAFNTVFEIDTNAVAGTPACFTVSVTPLAGDYNPSNNTLSHCFTIVNALDPNEKEVYPTSIDSAGQWLTYTIRFQNTGSAPAVNIRIIDTLSSNLDPSGFQLLAYSAKNLTQLSGNVVTFNFPNINLPDSLTSNSLSRGFVQYRVKTGSNVTPGQAVSNTAYIYFDLNPAVVTNTVTDTVQRACVTTYDTITHAICQGDTFYIGTTAYTTAGNFNDTLTNAGGCDSVVTLNLSIDSLVASMININGDTFCSQASAVVLSCQPTGGTFMGTGVSGNQFNPASANTGADTVYYTYTDSNQCSAVSKGYVDVVAFPSNITATYTQSSQNPQNAVTTFSVQPEIAANYIWQELYPEDSLITNLYYSDTFITVCWNYGERPIDTIMGDNYSLTVRAIVYLNGCADTTQWVTITCQVWGGGINQITANNSITLYPNPATDQLFIKTEGINPQSISIYDIDGRLISTQAYKPEIDINRLSSGVYFIEVSSVEGVARKRFVKM